MDKDGSVCWAREQDPRSAPFGLTSEDLLLQLKNEVEKVYSVGIYNSASGTRGAKLTPQLKKLLSAISSGDSVPYFQSVDLKYGKAQDLTSFFKSIVADACK